MTTIFTYVRTHVRTCTTSTQGACCCPTGINVHTVDCNTVSCVEPIVRARTYVNRLPCVVCSVSSECAVHWCLMYLYKISRMPNVCVCVLCAYLPSLQRLVEEDHIAAHWYSYGVYCMRCGNVEKV